MWKYNLNKKKTKKHEHITGSSLELSKVVCFVNLTSDEVLVFSWIASSCQVNLFYTGPGFFGSRLTVTQDYKNLTKV